MNAESKSTIAPLAAGVSVLGICCGVPLLASAGVLGATAGIGLLSWLLVILATIVVVSIIGTAADPQVRVTRPHLPTSRYLNDDKAMSPGHAKRDEREL